MTATEQRQLEDLRREIARVRRRIDRRVSGSGVGGAALQLITGSGNRWRQGVSLAATAAGGWFATGRPGAKIIGNVWNWFRQDNDDTAEEDQESDD